MICRNAVSLAILMAVFVSSLVVSGANAQYMYWTDTFAHRVQRANLDGSNLATLVETPGPRGIALDVNGGKMYWSDSVSDAIYRANLDGSGVEELVTTGLIEPRDVALDLPAGKMYWPDFGTDTVRRANLDGSDVEDLVTTGLSTPYGLILDLSAGKMYWVDAHVLGNPDGIIQRANLDGSDIEDLVTDLVTPVGIELDVPLGHIYWTDEGTNKIQRADLDGSNVEDIVTTGLDWPLGIALDLNARKVYWTDAGTKRIQRANLDGSDIEDLVTTGLSNPREIALLSCDAVGPDCQGNGIPDYCEILTGADPDCNDNDIPDDCDIATGFSEDCNPPANGIPDECEPDCNNNGIADTCDIANGTTADCNRNAVPDECDIAAGASDDCNNTDVPDECEDDCNWNGIADECDIADATSNDCNETGIPDECESDCNDNGIVDQCDVTSGTSDDCNGNGVPDECESDCNYNGIADECDLANGTSLPCGVIELVPSGSTGPYRIVGNEIIIPGGPVQIEFELIVRGWASAPDSPSLGAYQGTFLQESLNVARASASQGAGARLKIPLWEECDHGSDCSVPSPPPFTQSGTCGTLEAGLCDDSLLAFLATNVCDDALRLPCQMNTDCTTGVPCIENPRFVFWGLDSVALVGFPTGAGHDNPRWAAAAFGGIVDDGETSYYGGTLRLVVPEDARGSYTLRLDSSRNFTMLLTYGSLYVPAAIINGRVTIARACCMPNGSCELLGEYECEAGGGVLAADSCGEDADNDGVADACDPCPNNNPDDSDYDGVCDSDDGCPNDPDKTEPGECGCGKLDDGDSDDDGVPDCLDQCFGVDDAVYAPECLDTIPTVSQWGLAVLTLLLLITAKVQYGRTHATSVRRESQR